MLGLCGTRNPSWWFVCSASSPPTELGPQHRSWHSFLSNDFEKVLYLQLIGSKVGLKYLQTDQNCDINSLTQDHWSDQSDSHPPYLPSFWNMGLGKRDEKSRPKQENWAWGHEEDLDWCQLPETVSKQKPGWSSNDPEAKDGARRGRRGQWGKQSLGQMSSFVWSWSLDSRILTLVILETQLGLPGALHWSPRYPPALHVS